MSGRRRKATTEDCIALLRSRADLLQAENQRNHERQPQITNAADRAAIAELRHAADLIECLCLEPFRGHPHVEARERWARGWRRGDDRVTH